ncbi:MAG: high light inducible protein [Phycisphaerae bacterium SM23_33]|nr:MAG: high light inducible protein [Phycisphaerae bacterium SM23_33]
MEIPAAARGRGLIQHFEQSVRKTIPAGQVPVRFVVTQSDARRYRCELGVLEGLEDFPDLMPESIFAFRPRAVVNAGRFNAVFMVPTGIGAEIGGHAGDAAPAARMLASICDTFITHPNVVNASDINELPENALYVEGSVVTRLLMGTVALQPVRSNRVMLLTDEHPDAYIAGSCINAASAARAALGADVTRVVRMDPPVHMRAEYSSSGRAVGRVEELQRMCHVLARYRSEFDAVALATIVHTSKGTHEEYYNSGGEVVNPWGGVEAMLTHAISMIFNVPSAHSPMMESLKLLHSHFGVVDPRMAAEEVSKCFLHCILKGLHRSPRLVTDEAAFAHPGVVSAADVSCLVMPDGCLGLPTLAALRQGIPVIAVRENRNRMRNDLRALPFPPGGLFVVENYLEAAGVMAALKAGVAVPAVRRPLEPTKVSTDRAEQAAGAEAAKAAAQAE